MPEMCKRKYETFVRTGRDLFFEELFYFLSTEEIVSNRFPYYLGFPAGDSRILDPLPSECWEACRWNNWRIR